MPNEENLGTKFTIDITDLKAGLAQANRLIRESESEFLEAAAGMEDWEESAEGLTKRTQTLSKQVDIQQEKVAALVKEKERIVKTMQEEGASNEEIEKAVDGVNKAIQREGKQLDTLKKKLKQSQKSLDKYENSTDDVSEALADMGEESEDTKDATERLTDEIKKQKDRLEKLKREYSNVVLEQGDMSDEAVDLKRRIKDLNKELQDNEKRLEGASDGLKGLNDGAKDSGDGFTVAKGAVAGFVAGGLIALVGAAGNAVSQMLDLAESTRETRTNMAKVKTAFEGSGFAAETATNTYKDFYAILGDEGQATEAVGHLAKITDSEKELAEWTDIATGVYATFGDSLPIESLTEAANETVKTGQVTGSLADALNWATMESEDWRAVFDGHPKALNKFEKAVKNGATAEEAFNEALTKCNTESEREEVIRRALTGLYGEAADAYYKTNESVIEANRAQADYNEATAELGGRVEPLNTALTNLKTTFVEWVTPAVGAASDALAGMITNMITAEEETDLLSETQRAAVTAAQDSAKAYLANKDAADAMADAGLANIDYGQRLLSQMALLIDEKGKVKAGEEEHAEFLLGQYNEALGTEYRSLSQIFDKNGEIKQSVYDVIEAKKAQIMMEAYEETYRQAVLNVAEAEKARAIQAQELAAQQEVADAARKTADEAKIALNEKVANAKNESDLRSLASEQRTVQGLEIEAKKQEGILNNKQTAYNETEDTLYGYYRDIEGYENANTLLMQGETDKAIKTLDKLGDGYQNTTSSVEDAKNDQKKILEQQVIDTEINAQLMEEAYEKGVEGVTDEMVKTAREQADAAKEEFEKVGGNITEGIAKGAEEKEWTLTGAMKSLVSKAVAAAKKAAGIESPSKLFKKEVGHWIGEGVAVGIDDSTASVVKSIDNQITSARKAYKVGKISDGITGAINTGATNKSGGNELASGSRGGVTVYQTNNYAQAHSRYELYKTKQATAAAVRLALGGVQ